LDAYTKKSKVINQYTQREEPPDERLMRSIEAKADIPEQLSPDFRRSIAAQIGSLSRKNQQFDWRSNPKLEAALKAKLFEDTREHIKLSALSQGAGVVAPEIRQKIDAVKKRLIDHYGYNEESATDTLNFVASIFARSDLKKEAA